MIQGRVLKKQFNVKIIYHDGKQKVVACTHIQKTPILETDESGNPPGLYIELCGVQNDGEAVRSEFVTLPQDAKVIYYMNERGDTVDKDAWNGPTPDASEKNLTSTSTSQKEMRFL